MSANVISTTDHRCQPNVRTIMSAVFEDLRLAFDESWERWTIDAISMTMILLM
jgi:hypothetical protein